MFEVLKQSILAGVGVALMTREKVSSLASDIAQRAQLTEQQAAEFEKELVSRAEQARGELQAEIDRRIDHAFIQIGIVKGGLRKDVEEAKSRGRLAIDDSVQNAIDRLGIARADDLKALALRLDALEKRRAS